MSTTNNKNTTITINNTAISFTPDGSIILHPQAPASATDASKLVRGMPCFVRDGGDDDWMLGIFWSHDKDDDYQPYSAYFPKEEGEFSKDWDYEWFSYCLPYQGNEHLFTPPR